MSEIHKYYNKPQLNVFLASAFEAYCEWSRGTGKSSGVIAPRIVKLAFSMPRGNFGIVAKTYQQLMTRTLPGVIKGLAELGYHRDIDYTIGRFADKKWKWELPFAPPLKADYVMHWRTGCIFNFISQDQKGMAAGLSLDAIIGDEAKHLNKELYEEELLPANRGNLGVWDGPSKDPLINGDLHHSILLCSDTPTSQNGRWFIDKEKMATPKKIQELLALENMLIKLRDKLLKSTSKASKQYYLREIRRAQALSSFIRKGDAKRANRAKTKADKEKYRPSVHFSRANVFDNIDVLGEEYVEQQYRNLPFFVFRTSILNQRAGQVLNGFYPDLNDRIHGYDRFDNSFFTNIGYEFGEFESLDSRQDGDVDTNSPLDLAPDYGGHFNCIVIGQHHGTEYRFVNSFHVKNPKKIKDLVREYKKYYRFHKRKEVNVFYDYTAKDTDAIRDADYYMEYYNELSKKDEFGSWNVNLIDCGRIPSYEGRHEFWSTLLKEESAEYPRFRYNRYHCEYWAISCMMAPMKIGKHGYEKDKASEKMDSAKQFKTPQEEATHYSDAGDTLAWFRIKKKATSSSLPQGSGSLRS